tara:strand:+ start:1453 stop:1827 length:375 start_codon:yes stop_codon:yes gene_type:complete
MNWWAIIKNEQDINDLAGEVADMLENSEAVGGVTPDGDYDDLLDGYRDSGETYVTDYITLEPTIESEEDDEVTVEFDVKFFDHQNDLRLGSYTGGDGYYFAMEDWGEEDREALLALKEHLEEKA